MEQISFLAFDLGATSGRSILGTLRDGKLQMKELTRFPNQILELGGHYYWNIFSLYEHLKAGMIACAKEGAKITSIGIDTWGVDFALIGEDGQILGMPLAYRDLHTTGAPEEYFAKVMPRKEVYDLTGIQVMNFNSLYQLYAMQRDHSSPLKAAVRALFMPDALSYMLTGKMATEYTIASTSQILNPRTKKMEAKLLEKMGVKGSLFGEVVPTGTVVGTLTDALAAETGLDKVPVVAVAGHDTASAVAAVPASDEKFAYLSSGTWSLMGIEVKDPVITDETAALNITNEGGVEGTTRLLKNITGMWILEQCIKEWKKEGAEYSYPEIVKMAGEATPFRSFIDPDDPSFANPPSMAAAIRNYCAASGQPVPQTHAELIRCIFESLALKYKDPREVPRAGPVPDRKASHHRRRFEKPVARPVYRQCHRYSGSGWPVGSDGHRQHHVAGARRRMCRFVAADARYDRQGGRDRDFHAAGYRCVERGLLQDQTFVEIAPQQGRTRPDVGADTEP